MTVNACIIRCTVDNKVLLVKHCSRGWEFPGGKMDSTRDKFKDTNTIDLIKCATREFHEEVSDQIGCVGSPSNVLFSPSYSTVFLVYRDQDCVFDCFENYQIYLSNDPAIEKVQQFTLEQLDNITFSFDSDKQLLNSFLRA